MELIDFNNYVQNDKMYGGLSGIKVGIRYKDEDYILKFPGNLRDKGMKNINLSYSNSPVCEYLGSHIYQKLGIKTHDTLLGIRKGKIVVACKDFLQHGDRLYEFREIKTTYEPQNLEIESGITSGNGTELNDAVNIINHHPILKDIKNIKEHFWDMFVVDAYIGNSDRNNGNWGIITRLDRTKEIAPVYDNGGCLNNKWDNEKMSAALQDKQVIKAQSYNGIICAFTQNEKKINPFHFIKEMKSIDCSLAVKRLVPRIKDTQQEIYKMININPVLSDIQKMFYKKILDERLNKALFPIYKKIISKEYCR